MLRFLVKLDVSHQIHAGAGCLECQISMHALPVLVEEFGGDIGFLVEEDESTEVRLLV